MTSAGTDALGTVAVAITISLISLATAKARKHPAGAPLALNVNVYLHLHPCQVLFCRADMEEGHGQQDTRSATSPQPGIDAEVVEGSGGGAGAARTRGRHYSAHRPTRGIDAGGHLSSFS